jgi:integrase/recombinase XerD
MERLDNLVDNDDPNFDRKLDLITAGADPFVKQHLLTKITRENCLVIINYLFAMQAETTVSERYRIDTINKLKRLAQFHNPKPFHEMTRSDVLAFLDRLRKLESVDTLHKWQGTHELHRTIFLRFFKWLYRPREDTPPKQRPIPEVMYNITKIKRKEISIYKPTDLWTEEDDVLFYRYCPSLRDRCWHAVSRDTGCRVGEMLRIKVKDVIVQQLENGYQIARINVSGKTGFRNVRLNNAYPRVKDWLSNGHPYPAYPNSPLFCGVGSKNTGRSVTRHTIHAMYASYKKERFPKLLNDPLVPEDDKRKISELLRKPWNPYIRRHTAATEISKALKDDTLIDTYMGWSRAGNTRHKYQHYYADDSFDAILTVMDGLKPPSNATNTGKKGLLRPRQCPNCNEVNKPENKFCSKCKFVLTFDAYNEKIQSAELIEKKVSDAEARLTAIEKLFKKFIADEQDWNPSNPEENKRIDETFGRILDPNSNFFGE